MSWALATAGLAPSMTSRSRLPWNGGSAPTRAPIGLGIRIATFGNRPWVPRGPSFILARTTPPFCGMASSNAPLSAFPRFAIIGGGISGLAAAYRLSEPLPQANIELFEASGRLGGILNTVQRGGFLIE